jgi:hypothetical protein
LLQRAKVREAVVVVHEAPPSAGPGSSSIATGLNVH